MPRRKYGSIKMTVDGHKFDSKKEAGRYVELKFMLDRGIISDLVLQPVFKISKGGVKDPASGRKMAARKYTADFKYKDLETGESVVEDVKSPITAKETAYRIRRQLFLEQYGHKYKFMET